MKTKTIKETIEELKIKQAKIKDCDLTKNDILERLLIKSYIDPDKK